jgi:hypothetical protein
MQPRCARITILKILKETCECSRVRRPGFFETVRWRMRGLESGYKIFTEPPLAQPQKSAMFYE